MEQSAEDDAERRRIRAQLYAPPKGSQAGRRRMRPPGMAMGQAQSLAAQLAAEDARLTGGH